jgi:hypothetical protein
MLNLLLLLKETSLIMLFVKPPILPEVVPVEQAQAVKHMEMVWRPPMPRMMSMMIQGHQGR